MLVFLAVWSSVPVCPGQVQVACGPHAIINSVPFCHVSLWKTHSAVSGRGWLHSCVQFAGCGGGVGCGTLCQCTTPNPEWHLTTAEESFLLLDKDMVVREEPQAAPSPGLSRAKFSCPWWVLRPLLSPASLLCFNEAATEAASSTGDEGVGVSFKRGGNQPPPSL